MGRPRKVIELAEPEVQASDNQQFPIAVYDPTAIQLRILEAYNQDELDKLLSGGWLLYKP
jgi:hypothetical protein